jgi:hypothetical protein
MMKESGSNTDVVTFSLLAAGPGTTVVEGQKINVAFGIPAATPKKKAHETCAFSLSVIVRRRGARPVDQARERSSATRPAARRPLAIRSR